MNPTSSSRINTTAKRKSYPSSNLLSGSVIRCLTLTCNLFGWASSKNNHAKDPEATTPETTTVNYTATEYIPPENWIEMFIWDQNGTTIDKYVEIPHRKANLSGTVLRPTSVMLSLSPNSYL